MSKLGLIAGNGRFPFLLLDAARAHGLTVVVAAIKEETDPEINARAAADPNIHVHWLSLGELSRLIETFQPKASPAPSWPARSSTSRSSPASVPTGASPSSCSTSAPATPTCSSAQSPRSSATKASSSSRSTHYLEPLLAKPGVLTSRAPDEEEQKDIVYGRTVARPSPPTISARPSSSPPRPASPSKPWKAPTPPSPAPATSSAPSMQTHPRPTSTLAAPSPSSKSPNPIRTCASTSPSSASPPFDAMQPRRRHLPRHRSRAHPPLRPRSHRRRRRPGRHRHRRECRNDVKICHGFVTELVSDGVKLLTRHASGLRLTPAYTRLHQQDSHKGEPRCAKQFGSQ